MTIHTTPEGEVLRQIALSNGIKPVTLYARIRRGWPADEAANTPPRPYFYEWEPTQ